LVHQVLPVQQEEMVQVAEMVARESRAPQVPLVHRVHKVIPDLKAGRENWDPLVQQDLTDQPEITAERE